VLFAVPMARRCLNSLRYFYLDFVVVRVGGTHAKRVHIVELLEWVDASTCSKCSCGRCRMYVRGAVSEVGRDACARAVHGRSGVQFFEFLSRIMRGLLAVPYGIQ
jgi:hypothetical protein